MATTSKNKTKNRSRAGSLFEHGFDPVIRLDSNLGIQDCNAAAQSFFGLQKIKAGSMPFKQLLIQGSWAVFDSALERASQDDLADTVLLMKNHEGAIVEAMCRIVPEYSDYFLILRRGLGSQMAEGSLAAREQFSPAPSGDMHAILLFDEALVCINSNSAVPGLLGYKNRQDVIGVSLLQILEKLNIRESIDIPEDLASRSKPVHWHVLLKEEHLNLGLYPVPQSESGAALYVLSVQNISALARSHEALQASEMRYRLLAENLNEGVNIANSDETILYANSMAGDILGIPRDELIGRNLKDIVVEEERHVILEQTERRAQGYSDTYDVHIRRPDGSRRLVHVVATPFVDERDGSILVLAAFRDVTDEREAERQLQQSERRYRMLVDNLDEGIGIVDYKENFVFANRKAAEIFGIEREKLIGTNLKMFMNEENFRKSRKQTRIREKGNSSRYELQVIRPDGQVRDISLVASPFIPDEEDGTELTLGAFIDITENKKIERELQRSRQELKSTIASMHDLLFVISRDGVFEDVHQQTYRGNLLLPPEQFIGEQYNVILPPDISDQLDRAIARLEKGTDELEHFDYSLEIDGQRQWFSSNVSMRRGAENEPVGYTIVARNITDRKLMEEALRESERRFRTTLDTMLEGCQIISTDWVYLYLNEVAAEQSNLTREKSIGRRMQDVITNFHSSELYRLLNISMQGRVPQIRELRLRDLNGESRWFEFKIQPVPEGIFILSLDITDRKRAENELENYRQQLERIVQERTTTLRLINDQLESEIDERLHTERSLRESEEKFRSLIESSHDGVIIIQDQRIVYVNQRLCTIIGEKQENLIHTYYRNVLFDDDMPFLSEQYYQIVADGKSINTLELRIKHLSGKSVHVEANAGRIYFQGKPAMFAFVRDITERRHAENKLEQHRIRLQNLAAELSLAEQRERRRIAVDLHDRIGQTLIFSRDSLERVREELSDSDQNEQLMKVSEMLDQTIDDTRTLMFEISPPILYDLGLEAALEWLLESIERRHGLSFVLQSDNKAKPLSSDEASMLFQASREIIVNIVKHAQAESVVIRSSRPEDGMIRIEIQDDGIGFDTSSVSMNYRSSSGGFGLFSVKERIHSMGGLFSLQSHPGEGTTVTLSLPVDAGKTLE